MFRSLWFRLTGTVVALVLFTLGVALVATLVIAGRQLTAFIENTTDEIIRITAPTALLEGQGGGAAVAGDPDAIVVDEETGLTLNDGSGGGIVVGPDGTIAINPGDGEVSQIEVQIPQIVRTQSAQLARNVANTVLIAVSLAAFLGIVAATWLFWQITRPLTRLRVAAEQVASGNLETRVQVKKKDEVGRVGLAFNHMAGELQRQEGLRKQMVADIAHELRTPLSVMQVNLEAMADGLLPSSTEELDGLHHEVLRLSRLVEDLRLLSLADAGQLEVASELLDANDLAEAALRRLQPQADGRGVVLAASLADGPAMLLGDEGKLQQVLANLLANALRHTPAGRRVELRVAAGRQSVTLQVADQGPGVDPAALPQLFERFYKGDPSRSRESGGSGLGLSIVKQLVELHGGSVTASLPPTGGLTITLALPAAARASGRPAQPAR